MKNLPWGMISGIFFANWLLVPFFKNIIDNSDPPDLYRGFFTGLIAALILIVIYSIKNLLKE